MRKNQSTNRSCRAGWRIISALSWINRRVTTPFHGTTLVCPDAITATVVRTQAVSIRRPIVLPSRICRLRPPMPRAARQCLLDLDACAIVRHVKIHPWRSTPV